VQLHAAAQVIWTCQECDLVSAAAAAAVSVAINREVWNAYQWMGGDHPGSAGCQPVSYDGTEASCASNWALGWFKGHGSSRSSSSDSTPVTYFYQQSLSHCIVGRIVSINVGFCY